jgi:hypothetical protein
MGQTSSSIQFHIQHDPEVAQSLLDEAEKKDFYVEECKEDQANALARKGYLYRATAMTPREHKFFEVVIENAKGKIPHRLRRELGAVHLIQLHPSAEGGMPHTRPEAVICYPDISTTFSVSTLLHELWHVHQRQHLGWWYGVFQRLGWEPWEGDLPPSMDAQRRFNPDTLDSPLWCFRRTWVPVPIFQDVARPKVTEVSIWFYHVSLKYHVKQIPKEMEAEYHSLPQSAYEHPRELAAYLLSDPVRYSSCPTLSVFVEVAGLDSFPPDLSE